MDANSILNAAMNITAWIENVLINGLLGRGFSLLTGGFGAILIDLMRLFAAVG